MRAATEGGKTESRKQKLGKGKGRMPVYQYWDRRRGVTVELRRQVELRDRVPAGLERIMVPQRISVFGTSSDRVDPLTADAQVPNALKALDGNTVNHMVKESGFSVDKFKEVWNL